ncbi:SusC/RagA family TonB-linked outer membrane protein [Niabella drilacis]|uniref:TonB-linked outer membrane protein, SusC/RagA family n=1 Tax=Niabella drilacis (strain DSM 25811 / CCM 8410 / CCUG 62505 / LMG 26954 / E90) TaxID=1285928 RepID=A0A1G7ACM0_NIADE|nr:TonB-dependent receptor [Niabella drilacis]SDE12678.1 TonB-linked outer membrane protein, SusC/RagA family [Niabella drilacis]
MYRSQQLFCHARYTRPFKRPPLTMFLLLVFLLMGFSPYESLAKNTGTAPPEKTITGKVTDEAGTPIDGVSVLLKGSNTGVVTDAQGVFSIKVPNSGGTLVISHVGYQEQEVIIGSQATISVMLRSSATEQLTDVVVVGYGKQKKVTVTGAVTQVKGAVLEKSPTVNLSNALAGRLPGVTAMQRSGEPGGDGSTLRIRGTNTLGNSAPLVVIDGVPDRAGGLERLNPAEVETMSVLKDASAAIYGARAANGVILITTKQGKTGKPMVSYDFSRGWQQPTTIPKMSNSAQYAELMNEQKLFSDVPYAEWDAAWKAFKETGTYTKKDGKIASAYYTPDDVKKFADGSSPLTHPNTDWYNTVFKKWSAQQNHTLQISGGSEAVKYLASLGYLSQDAYYKNSATGYQQYDIRMNLEAKVNKYITTTIGISGREEYRRYPTVSAATIFRMLLRGKPTEVAVWPNGLPGMDIENGQNPVAITTGATGYDRNRRDYIQTNGQVDITNPWVKGLKLTLQGAVDKYIRRDKTFATPWYLYSWDKKTYEADGVTPKLTKTLRSTFTEPDLRQADEAELRVNLVGMLNYDRVINENHTIGIMAGIQRETRDGDNFWARRKSFVSDALDILDAGNTDRQELGGSAFNRATLSYFGRATYNYREKYLAEFLWRYDGSYFFAVDKQFGFFPGILVGWNISKEKFMENVRFLNNLKLRASYGQMGNDQVEFNGVSPEYGFISLYQYGTRVVNGKVVKSLVEPIVPNPAFTWEVADNANIGLEGSILNNKVNFEFEVFKNQRKQILIQRLGSTPLSSGIVSKLPPVNGGQVENKGFEFTLGYNGRVSDFNYQVSLNGAYTKNKVIFWDENPGVPSYQRATGHPFGTSGYAFLAYEYDGVFKDAADIAATTAKISYSDVEKNLRPGDMKFKDINGDSKINALDQVRLDKTRDPVYTTGLNINMAYKSFDLSVLFYGAFGGLQLLNFNETGEFGNWLDYSYNHRWSADNPSSVDPRLVSRTNTYYTSGYRNNTYWLRSNNYVRFKNFELGYTLNSAIGNQIGIKQFRVYLSGQNLVTWEKLKLWDPEGTAENGYIYPQSRIMSVGARLTF